MPKYTEKVKSELPPHSDDLEKTMLVAAVLNGHKLHILDEIFGSLAADDFYIPSNKKIFEAVKSLYEKEELIDFASVFAETGNDDALYGGHGLMGLITMCEEIPQAQNIRHTAKKLTDLSIKRDLAELTAKAHAASMNGKSPDEIIRGITAKMDRLQGDMRAEYEPEFIGADTLTAPPPTPDFIFEYQGRGLVDEGIVGAIAATGGTGKSFVLLQMALAMASGHAFGPFRATGKRRTLYINGEDSATTLKSRIWAVTGGRIPENFKALSVVGEVGPLMELSDGNPVRSKWFSWLDRLLKKNPFGLVIIDPLSRFFGLDELNGNHGTAFVSALEYLSQKHKCNILIAHHTNEASQEKPGRMSKTMLRGNSALSDGFRWVAGMRKMTAGTAKQYGLSDGREHIEFDVIKSNNGQGLPHPVYFHQNQQTGAFEHINPEHDRLGLMAETLVDLLASDEIRYTRRELVRQPKGKPVAEAMKQALEKFTRSTDMDRAIDYALENGLLTFETAISGKIPKEILVPWGENKPERYPESRKKESRIKPDKNSLSAFNTNKTNMIKPENDKAGKKEFSAFKPSKINTIKPEKIHSLKGEVESFPAFHSPLVPDRQPGKCSGCPHGKDGIKCYAEISIKASLDKAGLRFRNLPISEAQKDCPLSDGYIERRLAQKDQSDKDQAVL